MENTTPQTEELNKNNEATENASAENQEAFPASKTFEESEVIKLRTDVAEAKDKYLRLYSEFENFRRRTSKEKLEMIQSANEQLIKAMLPVADDFERAEKALKDGTVKESEGFTLIRNKFQKTLEQYGVKTMIIDRGSSFDPDFHEAITQIPAPEESLKGKIVEVIEKGYLLNEKVIRYAKVVVGN
jgi:molecular chaperone GrpE